MNSVLALLVALSLSPTAPAQPEAQSITYPLEGFETALPGLWQWTPQNQGSVEAETANVHGGQRAAALSWDFSKATGFFANFTLHERLVGQVQELRAWVYATKRERGAPLTLWIEDASGEMTIQRATVDWTGWQEVSFRIAGVQAGWASGDANGRQDPPLSLFGLAVEHGGPAVGRLVLDDISVVTLAAPRNALGLLPTTGVDRGIFWDSQPQLTLPLTNYSATAVPGVRCRLETRDLYRDRVAWSDIVDFGEAPAGSTIERRLALDLPYGAFRVHWVLADDMGELLSGDVDLSRMLPKCYGDLFPAARAYERATGLIGGVFGVIPPPLASDTGARWIRYENTTWEGYEKSPGQFDMSSLPWGLQPYLDAGIDAMILQTFYQRPSFRNPDQPDFARAYGEAMRQTALATRGLTRSFELGNEDNGPTKMLYSEVARSAVAGIRSAQPGALIANSGTAFVDLGWLEMQAARGVFDGLDALCTHPYTVSDSPEAWTIYERLGQVNELIDRLGGMKQQWTTEFGWPHDFDQHKRADWIPRHLLIGAAAGLDRHGLYTWERDYGIFQGVALPPAVSTHALARFLEGHRFVGLLRHDDEAWVSVFERSGAPLLVAWSPRGSASLPVAVTDGARACDLFGNPLPLTPQDGALSLTLETGPTYVTGIADSVVTAARGEQCQLEAERFARCLKAVPQPPAALGSLTPSASAEDLRDALQRWSALTAPVTLSEQAVAAQALRWLDVAPWTSPPADLPSRESLDAQRADLRQRLASAVADGTDIPGLRYLVERCDRHALEEDFALADAGPPSAARAGAMQSAHAAVAARLAQADGPRHSFGLWPYLYTLAADGTLQETLRFVPGQPAAVRLRVSNWTARARPVEVSFSLPAGWTAQPERVSLSPRPGEEAESEVTLTCPADPGGDAPTLRCVLSSDGLPDRFVTFDDITIEPPVTLTPEPVLGLLPATPLHVSVGNSGAAPISGVLRLLLPGDNRALARASFGPVPPGDSAPLALTLRTDAVAPPGHEWPLTAQFILADGTRVQRPVTIDFAAATRPAAPPAIDGDLAEWAAAPPLHIDQPQYARASFGTKWSPQDCSAVTWLQWDDDALYFAARVSDQTFNQALSGTSQWIQDSIQLSLAHDERSPRTELGFALTPAGEEVVSYTAPTPAVPGARLKVKLSQGQAIYEAAIPWSALPGLAPPVASEALRLNIVINDDDAIAGRRFLERYGGIAHDKNVARHGYLRLLAQTGLPVAPLDPAGIFREDFEEYAPGTIPDGWETVFHEPPFPEVLVQAGAGRDGSRALVLRNETGVRPFVYRHVVCPLSMVRPDGRYELSFWMRGEGVAETAGIVGVCSDRWGNEAFAYAQHGEVSDDWRQVTMPFTGPPGGRLNLIVRNASAIGELAIDDITVRAVP